MSNFQTKLNLLDAAWQIARNTRRELLGLRANPASGLVFQNVINRLGGIEANLDSLRELIQEEETP